jgi:tetratricopeptide (TPR) repeat protein
MTKRFLTLCGLTLVLIAAASPTRAEDVTLLRAREGAAALLRGQYEKAVASYDEALTNPEIADFVKASIYSDRGVAKWRLKQTKEAVDDFNQSIQISPENATVYNNRGNALMDLGHPEEAVKDFDRAIALSPNYGAAYNNRGNAHTALAQYDPAFQDFRKAVELMPTSAVPFNGRGKAHAALMRYHAALRDFSKAISINEKYEAAYENRGQSNLALSQYSEAADDFTQALNITPNQPDLLLLRARAHIGDKKYNPALDDLKKVIELKPDLVDAYIERGNLYSQVRRLDDAIADLNHAIELSPQNAKAYTMRALAKFQAEPPVRKKPQAESVVAKQPAEAQANGGGAKPDAAAATTPDANAATAPDAAAATTPDTAGMTAPDANAPTTPDANAAATPDTAPDASAAPASDTTAGAPADAAAETQPAADASAVPSDQASDAALSDAQQALTLAPDDAFALRVRGDIYRAMGQNDEAIADYRQALEKDPFQSESRDALVKLDQDVPPEQGLPLGPPVSDWVIKEPSSGRYIASNPKYPKLRAELEMFGAGKPRILEWSQMKDALAGIGLLRYDAGDLSENGGQDLVYTAIVDLWANKVVSIEPYSWGANAAKWDWQAYSVVVTDPDGVANEIKLRKPKARPVAREEGGGGFFDSPWVSPGPGQAPARRRGGGGGGGGRGIFSWFR